VEERERNLQISVLVDVEPFRTSLRSVDANRRDGRWEVRERTEPVQPSGQGYSNNDDGRGDGDTPSPESESQEKIIMLFQSSEVRPKRASLGNNREVLF
jgi:hypothetical protein